MKRITLVLVAVALVVLSSPAAAGQSKVNFNGTWALVPDPAAAGASGLGGPVGRGFEFSVVQDDKTLTVTTTKLRSSTLPSNGPITTYNLNGTANTDALIPELVEIAGRKLVITRPPQSQDKYSETWSLAATDRLVIQVTNYALVNPNKVAVYKKLQ